MGEATLLTSNKSLLQAVPDARGLLSFAVFNVVNFQIALGPVQVLMAHHWGASNFFIGALASLVPLLTTLQLFMAPRVEYIGYRRVMLAGWGARNAVLGLIAIVPFVAASIGYGRALGLLFILMAVFNTLRGLASASWLPWVRWLVPESYRGRYISAEQLVINLSSAGVFFMCGMLLRGEPSDLHFGGLFVLAFASGWVSLFFLRKVDAPDALEGRPDIEPLRNWTRRVWQYRPFRRLIRLNVAWAITYGAWSTFTIVFLREELHMSESAILYITGASTLGAVVSASMWGRATDAYGSRPVMAIATRLLMILMAFWLLIALGLLPGRPLVILPLYVALGIGMLGFIVANGRYALNNAPVQDTTLALTLFSVVASLSTALAPVFWGGLLDLLKHLRVSVAQLEITQFTWFYSLCMCALFATKLLIRRLPDAQARETHVLLYHMITDYPLRTWNAVYRNIIRRNPSGQP